MVVLDSDILIGILREDESATNCINGIEKKGEKLHTTVINAFEVLEGAFILSNEKKLGKIANLIRSLGCYNFDSSVSWRAAEISADLKKKGEIIDFQDIAIAAIAIVNGEALITRNIKHFRRIKGLKTKKW